MGIRYNAKEGVAYLDDSMRTNESKYEWEWDIMKKRQIYSNKTYGLTILQQSCRWRLPGPQSMISSWQLIFRRECKHLCWTDWWFFPMEWLQETLLVQKNFQRSMHNHRSKKYLLSKKLIGARSTTSNSSANSNLEARNPDMNIKTTLTKLVNTANTLINA